MSSLSYYDAMELPPGTPPQIGDRYVIDTDEGQKMAVIKNYNEEGLPPSTQFVFSTSADGRQQLFALVPTDDAVEEEVGKVTERDEAGTSTDSGDKESMPQLQIEREELIVDNFVGEEGIETAEGAYDSEGDEKPPLVRQIVGRNAGGSMVIKQRSAPIPDLKYQLFSPNDITPFLPRNSDADSGEQRYCPGCRMMLKRSIYYHHTRMIRKYGICNMFTPKRFPCSNTDCPERLGTLEALCNHLHQIHNAPTQIQTRICQNESEFQAFLLELEGKGGNFRMSRGNKNLKQGVVQYFRCNRMQSTPKSKTKRMYDEITEMNEPVDFEAYLEGQKKSKENPFENDPTNGGKTHLRTENACTAFFRKVYMPDGTIEVRYCDYHLHEDERLRLPPLVKQRIEEMYDKKLPIAVIILVLKGMLNVLLFRLFCCVQMKCIATATRAQRSNERSSYEQAEAEEMMTPDMIRDSVAHVDVGNLTELEQKMLELYEANHDVILDDMQKIRREENKKRHLRENIRNRLFAMGRFIKTSSFTDMHIDELMRMNDMIESINFMMEESFAVERMDIRGVKTEPNELMDEQQQQIRAIPKESIIVRRHRNLSDEDEIVDVQEVDMHSELIVGEHIESTHPEVEMDADTVTERVAVKRMMETAERQMEEAQEEMIVMQGEMTESEERIEDELVKQAEQAKQERGKLIEQASAAAIEAQAATSSKEKDLPQKAFPFRRGRTSKRTPSGVNRDSAEPNSNPALSKDSKDDREENTCTSSKQSASASPAKKKARKNTEPQESDSILTSPRSMTRTGRVIKPRIIRDI
ncbi:hypothetical protein WR25_15840 [Diploscapter pachys]|uniref:C2H2-type domain-containing protein n=1 Tax=Diploscapter pachys TaxID=2018661 RepID=A0A2A2J7X6_9BILA|nr:hypothetical protein WR25_15840 [Diploscapter pachys]